MLETIWRPKSPHLLSDAQRQEKLKKDSEYQIAHMNLSAGKSKMTQDEFEVAHSKQWKDYETWAIGFGLYEEVTPEQQLTEAEAGLTMQIEQINLIRTELSKPLVEVNEKLVK